MSEKREEERSKRDVPDAHGKGVDVLVELIEEGDGLDDVVIGTVDVELDFATRVAVSKTELGLLDISLLELLDELGKVETDTAEELEHLLRSVAAKLKRVLDGGGELLLRDTELDLGALSLLGLGEVGLEEESELLGQDT